LFSDIESANKHAALLRALSTCYGWDREEENKIAGSLESVFKGYLMKQLGDYGI
jgi:hypothetical protein